MKHITTDNQLSVSAANMPSFSLWQQQNTAYLGRRNLWKGGWEGKPFLSTGEQMHLKSKWIIEMDKMFGLEGICHCLAWKQGCSKELADPPFTFSVNAQSFYNHIHSIVLNSWTRREAVFFCIIKNFFILNYVINTLQCKAFGLYYDWKGKYIFIKVLLKEGTDILLK